MRRRPPSPTRPPQEGLRRMPVRPFPMDRACLGLLLTYPFLSLNLDDRHMLIVEDIDAEWECEGFEDVLVLCVFCFRLQKLYIVAAFVEKAKTKRRLCDRYEWHWREYGIEMISVNAFQVRYNFWTQSFCTLCSMC